MSDIIKKPKIELEEKPSSSYVPVKKRKEAQVSLQVDKKFLLGEIDETIVDLNNILSAFEDNAYKYSITTNNQDIIDAVSNISDNNNVNNISYPVYLMAKQLDGSSSDLITSVYETKSLGLWGNYSIKAISLLDTAKRELESIKNLLNKTEIANGAFCEKIYPFIMTSQDIVSEISIMMDPNAKENIKLELSGLTKKELVNHQITLNEQLDEAVNRFKRQESSLKTTITDTSSYYYSNLPNMYGNYSANNAQNDSLSSLKEMEYERNQNELKYLSDLEYRAEAYLDHSMGALYSLWNIASLQIMNQAIVETGGVDEIEVSDSFRDKPDVTIFDEFSEKVTGTFFQKPSISMISDKSMLDVRNQFVAVEEFNTLKDSIFWGDTTQIDGGNIKTGTIQAGAIQLGFKPLRTNITFAGGVLLPTDTYVPFGIPYLYHSSGYIETWDIDKIVQTFDLDVSDSSTGVLVDETQAHPVIDKRYYIYALLSASNSKILLRDMDSDLGNPEESYVDNNFTIVNLGIYDTNNGTTRVILSYGTTIINGSEIITGSITADRLDTQFIQVGYAADDINNGDTWISSNKVDVAGDDLTDYLDNIEIQVDGKTESFYQTTEPHQTKTNVIPSEIDDSYVGDLWYDSDDTSKVTYIYRKVNTGTSTDWTSGNADYKWYELEVPDAIFDFIDGKRRVFTTTPTTPYDRGDLWLTSLTSGQGDLKKCITARSSGLYQDSDWGIATRYTDDNTVNTLRTNCFYGTSTTINGGTIETGTVSAGALIIGERNVSLTGKFVPNTANGVDILNGHLYYPGGVISVPISGGEWTTTITPGSDVCSETTTEGDIFWIYAEITGTTAGRIFTPSSALIATAKKTATSPYYGMPADSSTKKYKKIGLWTIGQQSYGTIALSLGQTYINGGELITGTVVADYFQVGGGTSSISEAFSYTAVTNTFDPYIIEDVWTQAMDDNLTSRKSLILSEYNNIISSPIYAEVDNSLKTSYISSYNDVTTIAEPNVGDSVTQNTIDTNINNKISTYYTEYNKVISAMEILYINSGGTVRINSNGIQIGTLINGAYSGPNSQLSSSQLEFKYGSESRVLISSDGAVISKPILQNGTLIQNYVTLPPVVYLSSDGSETNQELVIQTSDGKININFL